MSPLRFTESLAKRYSTFVDVLKSFHNKHLSLSINHVKIKETDLKKKKLNEHEKTPVGRWFSTNFRELWMVLEMCLNNSKSKMIQWNGHYFMFSLPNYEKISKFPSSIQFFFQTHHVWRYKKFIISPVCTTTNFCFPFQSN